MLAPTSCVLVAPGIEVQLPDTGLWDGEWVAATDLIAEIDGTPIYYTSLPLGNCKPSTDSTYK